MSALTFASFIWLAFGLRASGPDGGDQYICLMRVPKIGCINEKKDAAPSNWPRRAVSLNTACGTGLLLKFAMPASFQCEKATVSESRPACQPPPSVNDR